MTRFKSAALGAACMLAMALPTFAQTGSTSSSSSTSSPSMRELVDQARMRQGMPAMGAGASMMASDGTMAPSMTLATLSAQDQLFMVRAAEGNLAEITLAQLAMQKSKTPGVKSVAQTIITGHGQAQTDLMALASRKGMMMKPMLSPTHVAVSNQFGKAKGDTFDKMYMANQSDDHENTIALFQSQVENGQDADLKAYAQKYLPDIVGHTIMIYTVARQVGAPGSEMRPPTPPVPPGVTPTVMPMDGMTSETTMGGM